MEDSIGNLYPLIVPAEYLQTGIWKLPHIPLRASDLILTWVVLHAGQTMVYVTENQVGRWKETGVDWSAVAIENMRRGTGDNPATHEKRDENGVLQWVAMMQEDGLGSSRVFLKDDLQAHFPEGWLAIPERSVGMALSRNAAAEHKEAFMQAVQKCHRHGTTPRLGRLLSPTDVTPVQ